MEPPRSAEECDEDEDHSQSDAACDGGDYGGFHFSFVHRLRIGDLSDGWFTREEWWYFVWML